MSEARIVLGCKRDGWKALCSTFQPGAAPLPWCGSYLAGSAGRALPGPGAVRLSLCGLGRSAVLSRVKRVSVKQTDSRTPSDAATKRVQDRSAQRSTAAAAGDYGHVGHPCNPRRRTAPNALAIAHALTVGCHAHFPFLSDPVRARPGDPWRMCDHLLPCNTLFDAVPWPWRPLWWPAWPRRRRRALAVLRSRALAQERGRGGTYVRRSGGPADDPNHAGGRRIHTPANPVIAAQDEGTVRRRPQAESATGQVERGEPILELDPSRLESADDSAAQTFSEPRRNAEAAAAGATGERQAAGADRGAFRQRAFSQARAGQAPADRTPAGRACSGSRSAGATGRPGAAAGRGSGRRYHPGDRSTGRWADRQAHVGEVTPCDRAVRWSPLIQSTTDHGDRRRRVPDRPGRRP